MPIGATVPQLAPTVPDPTHEHHDAEKRQAESEDHADTVAGEPVSILDFGRLSAGGQNDRDALGYQRPYQHDHGHPDGECNR